MELVSLFFRHILYKRLEQLTTKLLKGIKLSKIKIKNKLKKIIIEKKKELMYIICSESDESAQKI